MCQQKTNKQCVSYNTSKNKLHMLDGSGPPRARSFPRPNMSITVIVVFIVDADLMG